MELIEAEDGLDKETIMYDFVPLTIESKDTSLYINDQSRGVIQVIARLKLANRHVGRLPSVRIWKTGMLTTTSMLGRKDGF